MLNLNSKMFEESRKSTASKNIISNIIAFVLLFSFIMLIESIIPTIMSNAELKQLYAEEGLIEEKNFARMMEISTEVSMMPKYFIPTLFCQVFGVLISMVYCRFIEGRYLKSMGVCKVKVVPHYLTGLAVGGVMMTVIVLVSTALNITGISACAGVNYGLIVLYLFGFFFQGMSEEFIFRGCFMTTIGANHKPLTAVIISSVAFSLAHIMNPGFNLLTFVNLSLFGAFASVYMICFDDIWGVCAVHSIWNFMQGNFYGISVSGTGNTESVFRTYSRSSSVILTGGDFGIEGSIVTTFVLIAGIAVVLCIISKRKPINTN